MAAAVSQIRGSGMTAAEIFQTLESSQGPGDLRYRAQVAFQTMYNMISSLDEVHNRRKAIVYISSGYDFDPYADAVVRADLAAALPALLGRAAGALAY